MRMLFLSWLRIFPRIPGPYMFSIFNRSLEVYEEDYVNGIIPY